VVKCTPGTGGAVGGVVVGGDVAIDGEADGTVGGVVTVGVVDAGGVVADGATPGGGDAVGMAALRPQPVAASTRTSPAAAVSGRRRAVRARVGSIDVSRLAGSGAA
jgi:hypothetical protein